MDSSCGSSYHAEIRVFTWPCRISATCEIESGKRRRHQFVIKRAENPRPCFLELTMALSLSDIQHLFDQYGSIAYSGEPVSQLQHALQSAALAEQAGTAARTDRCGAVARSRLLAQSARRNADRVRHRRSASVLRAAVFASAFSDAVLEPNRLHVDAKRCLCAIDPSYHAKLSADSVRSLQLQGGIFSDEDAKAFLARPYAEDALALHRWDDQAKDASRVTPDPTYYIGASSRAWHIESAAHRVLKVN